MDDKKLKEIFEPAIIKSLETIFDKCHEEEFAENIISSLLDIEENYSSKGKLDILLDENEELREFINSDGGIRLKSAITNLGEIFQDLLSGKKDLQISPIVTEELKERKLPTNTESIKKIRFEIAQGLSDIANQFLLERTLSQKPTAKTSHSLQSAPNEEHHSLELQQEELNQKLPEISQAKLDTKDKKTDSPEKPISTNSSAGHPDSSDSDPEIDTSNLTPKQLEEYNRLKAFEKAAEKKLDPEKLAEVRQEAEKTLAKTPSRSTSPILSQVRPMAEDKTATTKDR